MASFKTVNGITYISSTNGEIHINSESNSVKFTPSNIEFSNVRIIGAIKDKDDNDFVFGGGSGLTTNAVRTEHIRDSNITVSKLSSVSGSGSTVALTQGPTLISPIMRSGFMVTNGDGVTVTIGSNDISDGSVGSAQLADDSITTVKLADGAVTSDKLADDVSFSSITITSNLLPSQNSVQFIGTSNLHFKEAWIDTIHVSDGSVGSAQLADDSITTVKLADGAVTSDKLADDVSFSSVTITSNLLPSQNSIQFIGTSNLHFKEAWIDTIHISSNTLYLGDTPVLGTESDSIQITADVDQSINIKTTGLGQTSLLSSNGVNITTTGANKSVDIQASGPGGRVVFAGSEVTFTTPSTTFSSNVTVQGSTTVLGNFVVSGTTTTVNTTNLNVQDNIITLNANEAGPIPGVSLGSSGLKVYRGDSADPYQIVFVESESKLKVGLGNTTSNLVSVATEPFVDSRIAIAESNLATKSYVNTTISGSNLATQPFVHSVIAASNLATQPFVHSAITGSNLATQPFVHSVISASNLATKAYVDASAPSGTLSSASNLSDLANATTARNNLGLGSANTVSFSSINAGLAYAIGNPISARNSSNITTASTIDKYPLLITSGAGTTGSTTGIALLSVTGVSSNYTPGASITYERSSVATGFKGNMNFNVQTTGGTLNALTTAMTIYNDGNVGIGTSNPTEKLHVDGNIIATGGFGENGNQVKTKTVNLINNQEGTSKMVFTRDQLSFKVIITSEMSTLAQEYATYEEFEVIWNGRLDTPPKIYNHKYFINNKSSTVFLNRGKFFYDSVSGNFTIEHSRSTSNASVNVRAIFIGHVNHPTILTDTSIPSGAEITDIQGLCAIGDNSGTNIGIGTSNPTEILHIKSTAPKVILEANTGVETSGFFVRESGWPDLQGIICDLSGMSGSGANRLGFYVASSNSIGEPSTPLWTNGNVRMTINDLGNVGIGTSNPTYKLDVNGDANFTSNLICTSINAGESWGLGNPISARNNKTITTASTIDNYPLLITSSVIGSTGIALSSVTGTSSNYTPGASITYERFGGANGFRGNMNFNVQTTTGLSNALTTAMTIYRNGNVGIGTSEPTSKLHVDGDATFTNGNIIVNSNIISDISAVQKLSFINGTNTGSPSYETTMSNAPVSDGVIMYYIPESNDPDIFRIEKTDQNTDVPDGRIEFTRRGKNGTSIVDMSIYNGNVGIGTSNPITKLHVVGDGNNDQVMAFNTAAMCYSLSNNGGGFGILGLAKIADNYSASAQANDLVLRNTYGNLLLQTGNTNAAVVINSSNYVGIGTTTPTEKLSVSGNIVASGNISAYATVTSSDARLKTNRSLLEDALSTINKLNPQIYDKQTNLVPKEEDPEPRREAGLIAQDIWNYVPELRHTIMNINSNIANEETPIPEDSDIWGELPLGINYTSIIPYLIKALQEQQKQIFELQQKIL